MGRREFFAYPFSDAGKIQDTEKNQHQADSEFHGEADTRGNHDVKEDDGSADEDDGDGVAESPKRADERGFGKGTFAADDGGDGNDVIRVGGMAHAKEEADKENRKSADHKGGCWKDRQNTSRIADLWVIREI